MTRREEVIGERERLLAQTAAQQDTEWSARCRAIEHDQRLQFELAQRRLADERAYFDAQCVRRESALADEVAADRADIARQRHQLEEERNQVRHSLQQMDRQLRLIASNIESPMAPVAIGLIDDRQPRAPSNPILRLDDSSQTVSAPHLLEVSVRSEEPYRGSDDLSRDRQGAVVSRCESPLPDGRGSNNSQTLRIATNRATDSDTEALAARRRALEQYRQMLGELQVQVNELRVASCESRVASDAASLSTIEAAPQTG